jgi:tetratricopeptide (TPR) repeat protein
MEVIDDNGELACWLSDDPDDWNSWSDYERKIRTKVLDYNEEAFCLGEHLLGYDGYEAIKMIKLLSKININYPHHQILKDKLSDIRTLAIMRLNSNHPDEYNDPRFSPDWRIGENNYKKADKLWENGKRHKAIEYYERAALYGYAMAYEFLGTIYEQGLGGFTPDIDKAIKYYKEGADDDIGDCAFLLGICYRDGQKGLDVNYAEAYKWIRKAALLETCNAGNALGQCFENGWGCKTNLRKALYWYDVSLTGIDNGNRLRSILIQQGDQLPLKLDGFSYENVHYIQKASWWEDYYKKNNMIEE